MSRARVSPHHIPPDTTVAPAASPSTLCNPLPAHQHGQEASAAPSAAPDTPSAVPPAALAAGHDAEARATAQQITDAPTRQHTLAEVTAALSHPDSVDRPRHIRQAHAWQSYQQAAALSAGIVRLTGAAPAALRGASLDAFAENELLALVRALRNELIALGWSPP